MIATTMQSAHAMEMLIHNHEIPPQGRTLKYEFFNQDIHYVYFATRTVYQGYGTITINVPDEQSIPEIRLKAV
jgi:hypothetical protein